MACVQFSHTLRLSERNFGHVNFIRISVCNFYLDMSPPRYINCFDYLIRLSGVCGHPPFSPPTKFSVYMSRTHLVIDVVLLIRMIVTSIFGYRGLFIAMEISVSLIDSFIKVIQINVRFPDYQMLFAEMDEFLSENEFNAITGKRNHFISIWEKERPVKLVTAYLIITAIVTVVWSYNTVYNAAVSPQVPHPLYWSPYFELGVVVQWMYIVLELVSAFPLTLFPWYLSATFTSIVKFQYARFIYVKELALHIFGEECEKEKVVWWLKTHQQVLRSAYKVNDLLGLHALCSYFVITLLAVFAIIISLFENVTQDKGQKFVAFVLTFLVVAQFAYNCIIFDKWEEEERQIKETMFNDRLFRADQWQLSTYNICMARLNKPITFTGLNFVTLSSVTCRMIVTNIYSLYTSLMSVLRHKTL